MISAGVGTGTVALRMRWIGLLTPIAMGCAVLTGWEFNIPALKSVVPGFVAMNPATASGFVLTGLAFWCLHIRAGSALQHRVGTALSVIVLSIGALKLLGVVLKWRYGIDQILFSHELQGTGGQLPNRMAPNSALNFVLVGLALVLSRRSDIRSVRWMQALTGTLMLISFLALVGYLYGNLSVSGVAQSIRMSLHSALTFLLVGLGLLAVRAHQGPIAIVTSRDAGGLVARRLLPFAVAAPTLLGWLSVVGSDRGWFNASFGGEILAVTMVFLFIMVIGWTARSLNQADTARKLVHASLEVLYAERTATLEMAEHRSLHDPLTNLPNRTLLFDRVQQALSAVQRDGSCCSLLVLDLDGFKHVNDTLGHQAGDSLLQEVTQRMQNVVRASDTVARLGGDEFAILLPGDDRAGAEQVTMRIVEAIAQPLWIDEQEVAVGASIGIAAYPFDGQTVDDMVRQADIAMYDVKRARHAEERAQTTQRKRTGTVSVPRSAVGVSGGIQASTQSATTAIPPLSLGTT